MRNQWRVTGQRHSFGILRRALRHPPQQLQPCSHNDHVGHKIRLFYVQFNTISSKLCAADFSKLYLCSSFKSFPHKIVCSERETPTKTYVIRKISVSTPFSRKADTVNPHRSILEAKGFVLVQTVSKSDSKNLFLMSIVRQESHCLCFMSWVEQDTQLSSIILHLSSRGLDAELVQLRFKPLTDWKHLEN